MTQDKRTVAAIKAELRAARMVLRAHAISLTSVATMSTPAELADQAKQLQKDADVIADWTRRLEQAQPEAAKS